jgi:hypothetical protein
VNPAHVFLRLGDADIPNEAAVQEALRTRQSEEAEKLDVERFMDLEDVDLEVPGEDMDLGEVDPFDVLHIGEELVLPDGAGRRPHDDDRGGDRNGRGLARSGVVIDVAISAEVAKLVTDPESGDWVQVPLGAKVRGLEQLGLLGRRWPISDVLHVFKLIRERARGVVGCLDEGVPVIFTLEDLLKKMGEIKGIAVTERANTKFQDAPAVQFVSVGNLIRALASDCLPFLQLAGPWAMIGQVFYNLWLTRATRLVLLEIADAAFTFTMQRGAIDNVHLCETNSYTADGGVLHFWSSEHMRRGVTLCAGVYLGGENVPEHHVGAGAVDDAWVRGALRKY